MLECLRGKVVVITGASGTVGRELAVELAKEGATLILQCNTSKVLYELLHLGKLGSNTYVVTYDFSNPENIMKFVDYVKKNFSRVDVLINAVGIYDDTQLEELNYDTILKIVNVNLISVTIISKELGLMMKEGEGGIIINFSCLSALKGHEVYGCIKPSLPYVISKGGLIHLTKYLARELAPKVRIVTIAPGWISSPKLTSKLMKCIEDSTPLKRPVNLDEVVDLVKYIICRGTYLNGAVIEFSGGL